MALRDGVIHTAPALITTHVVLLARRHRRRWRQQQLHKNLCNYIDIKCEIK
ncbi:hypothetical protein K439DRAFT_713372 [Ramaria rubella]|nr:hypothetical protein K439DRAFT_713372 [Ramaria rubella]